MPNYFQFVNKETGKREKFNLIDDKLREHLGVDPDPNNYFRGWYDAFGEAASMGWSFERMRDELYAKRIAEGDEVLKKMLDWFVENYTVSAWYQPR